MEFTNKKKQIYNLYLVVPSQVFMTLNSFRLCFKGTFLYKVVPTFPNNSS